MEENIGVLILWKRRQQILIQLFDGSKGCFLVVTSYADIRDLKQTMNLTAMRTV